MADGAEPQQAPGVAPPLAPVHLFPNRDLLQYMQISSDFMGSINNQLETSTLIAGIHPFNGSSAANYRRWRKDMSRAAIERQPVDHAFMRRLVTRTVTDIAADFWQEVRNNDPNINWPAIQDVFRERFSNFVDAQLSLQTLMKLKQERKQTLHAFAQKIIETAHEAYNDRDYATPIVTRQLRDIFIDGLRCHKTSQHLIREDVPDLPAALNRAVRQELLHQTFKVRQVNTDSKGRHVEDMEIDTIEISEIESTNKEAPATQRQFEELSASVNAIAQNFKKAQGQFWKSENDKKENGKEQGKTGNGGNGNNRYQNRQGRNRNNHTTQPPPAAPYRYDTAPTPAPQYNSHEFIPGNPYHGYPQSPPQQTQYQHVPRAYNNTNNYTYQPPQGRSFQPQNTQQSQQNQRPRMKWTPDNRPICAHCDVAGHMRAQCWKLHSELRPARGNNQFHSRQGASN